jgi:DNA-binding MarR family transcriptional regulator
MVKKQRKPAKAARPHAARRQPHTLYLMKQVQYKAYVRLDSALQPLGVTAAQFRILALLSHGEKRSSAELSRVFGVKPQTMIKQIALLEQNGLIRRSVAKANKRVLEVELTERGRGTLADCDDAAVAIERKIFAAFAHEEVQTYRALMTKLLASIGRMAGDGDESALTAKG